MTSLGLAGAMVSGRTREKNLDHPDFLPMFGTAAKLGVPIFVHPQSPQRAVREVYYSGFGEPVDTAFAAFGLGWHYEAGIQFVRLMLAGVFDRDYGAGLVSMWVRPDARGRGVGEALIDAAAFSARTPSARSAPSVVGATSTCCHMPERPSAYA